jgi:hypothetical protein
MVAMDAPDWSRLFHADGPADDVPAQLAALTGADRDNAFDASVFVIRVLWASGTLTPATAAAMRPIAELLDEPALDIAGDTVRDAVLYLIRQVARLTTSVDIEAIRPAVATPDLTGHPAEVYLWRAKGLPGVALLDRALVDCYHQLPDVFSAVWPIRSHWSTRTRVMAAAAAAMLVRHPWLQAHRAEVVNHHEESARAAVGRWECAELRPRPRSARRRADVMVGRPPARRQGMRRPGSRPRR